MNNDEQLLLAIEEAERGPTPEDLELAPVLRLWQLEIDGSILRAVGMCDGHPLISEPYLTTSPIIGFDVAAGWMRTRSRWYRLTRAVDPAHMAMIEPTAQRLLGALRRHVKNALRDQNSDVAPEAATHSDEDPRR